MKKRFYDNGIVVRLFLLFLYPVGAIFLAVSKTIKHKAYLAFLYLVPFFAIVFPILTIIYNHNGDIERIVISEWYIKTVILIPLIAFPIVLVAYLITILKEKGKDYKNKKLIKTQIANNLQMVVEVDKQQTVKKTKKKTKQPVDKSSYKSEVEKEAERQQAIEDFKKVIKQLNNEDTAEGQLMSDSQFVREFEAINTVDVNQNATYQKVELLTDREKNFYETIRLIAEKYNLSVLSKVRLADIVKVGSSFIEKSPEWYEKFNKISRKHIDFALAGKDDLGVKLLIEIDDYSHNRQDRKERDEFVDWVCSEAGIPILHVTEIAGLETKIKTSLHIE